MAKKTIKDKEPIYTTDKKDPRLLAYNDSLIMYNAFKGHINALTKAKDFDDWSKIFDTVNYAKTDPAYNHLTKINKKSPKPIAKKERIFDNLGGSGYAEEYKKPVQPIKYKKEDSADILPAEPIITKKEIVPVQKQVLLPIQQTPQISTPSYHKRLQIAFGDSPTYQYLDKTGKELGRETYQGGKLVTPNWYDNNIMNSADNVGKLKYGGMKKNKNTTPRTLNPYITLFDLGGELSASPSYLSDIPEVSDTAIDPNLKLDTGKGFDIKSLLGMDLKGSNITTGLNQLTNVTDDRGIQDTKKSAINSGIGAGVEWGAKAFKATGNPLVAGGAALLAGGIAAGINNKKTQVANKQVADDLGNYYAGLPKMTSANPYKMEMGGDKSVNNFNGATHENGGIKLTEGAEVEGGETSYKDYVFSDSLKVPGKKITFAQATKKIEAKYKGRENDQYAERAKEQALTEYMQQNEMVKAMEERKQAHAQELQEIQMRFGGYKLGGGGTKDPLGRKYGNAGRAASQIYLNSNEPLTNNTPEAAYDFDPVEFQRKADEYTQQQLKDKNLNNIFNPDQSVVKLPSNDPYRTGNAEDYFPEDSNKENITTDNTKKKSKFGNEEMALGLSMLPGLYNVAKGWKPDSTNFQTMNPNLVNLESERENLRREAGKARLIANENVRQIGGGSGSALAALATQSSAINDSKMKGLSDSYQREHLANVTTLNDFLVRNTGIINEEYVANEQNKAMSDSLKSLGLSDLSNNGQGYLRDKELNRANDKSNKMKLDAMNSLFPNYKWGLNKENDDLMMEYVVSIGGTGGVGAYTGTSNKATKSNAKGTTTTTSTSTNNKSGTITKKTSTTKRG